MEFERGRTIGSGGTDLYSARQNVAQAQTGTAVSGVLNAGSVVGTESSTNVSSGDHTDISCGANLYYKCTLKKNLEDERCEEFKLLQDVLKRKYLNNRPWCYPFRFPPKKILKPEHYIVDLETLELSSNLETKVTGKTDLKHLFTTGDEKCSHPMWVLVKGEQGYGKSMLCHKIARNWAENVSESSFDLVVVIDLDMISEGYHVRENILSSLLVERAGIPERLKNPSELLSTGSVLLIFDGGNFSGVEHRKVINKLVFFKQDPTMSSCSVIITTHESVIHDEGFYLAFDKILRITSMSESNQIRLIRNYFQDSSADGQSLEALMRKSNMVNYHRLTPLVLHLICKAHTLDVLTGVKTQVEFMHKVFEGILTSSSRRGCEENYFRIYCLSFYEGSQRLDEKVEAKFQEFDRLLALDYKPLSNYRERSLHGVFHKSFVDFLEFFYLETSIKAIEKVSEKLQYLFESLHPNKVDWITPPTLLVCTNYDYAVVEIPLRSSLNALVRIGLDSSGGMYYFKDLTLAFRSDNLTMRRYLKEVESKRLKIRCIGFFRNASKAPVSAFQQMTKQNQMSQLILPFLESVNASPDIDCYYAETDAIGSYRENVKNLDAIKLFTEGGVKESAIFWY